MNLIHTKEDAAKLQSEERQKRQAVNVLGKLAKKIGAVRKKNDTDADEKEKDKDKEGKESSTTIDGKTKKVI